jgi:hypothetical protein
LNPRPPGYEPDELPTALSRDIAILSFTGIGAGDRTRTGTLSPAVDFESTTSTNSITPAWNSVIIPEAHPNCKCKFTVNPSEFKKLGLPNGRELWYDIVDKLCGGF